MRESLLLLLLPLLVLSISGCLDDLGVNQGGHGDNPVRAFSATYRQTAFDSPFELRVDLGPPQTILDYDLQPVQAYPLVIRDSSAPESDQTYWLSGDLRVIRKDLYCSAPCNTPSPSLMMWAIRGHWPPMGVGFNHLVAGGQTTQELWGSILDLSPATMSRDGVATLRFTTVNSDGQFRNRFDMNDVYAGFDGQFEYDGESLAPQRWHVGDGSLELVRIDDGPALPEIDPLRSVTPTAPITQANSTSRWFPGSETPLVGNRASVDDAMAAMSAENPDFENAVAEACVLVIQTGRTYLSGQNLELDATNVYASPFSAITYEPGALEHSKWAWSRSNSVLGESWSVGDPVVQPRPFANPCESPPIAPVYNASEHVRVATSFPWDDGKVPTTFAAFFHNRFPGCACPQLALRYQTGYGIPDVSGPLSVADQVASLGVWFMISGTLSELQHIDPVFASTPVNAMAT